MPLYEVLEPSYVDFTLYEAGKFVEYTAPKGTTVGPNLRLVKNPNAIANAEAEIARGQADLAKAQG